MKIRIRDCEIHVHFHVAPPSLPPAAESQPSEPPPEAQAAASVDEDLGALPIEPAADLPLHPMAVPSQQQEREQRIQKWNMDERDFQWILRRIWASALADKGKRLEALVEGVRIDLEVALLAFGKDPSEVQRHCRLVKHLPDSAGQLVERTSQELNRATEFRRRMTRRMKHAVERLEASTTEKWSFAVQRNVPNNCQAAWIMKGPMEAAPGASE